MLPIHSESFLMDALTQTHLFIPTYEVGVECSLKEEDITLESYRPEPSEHAKLSMLTLVILVG